MLGSIATQYYVENRTNCSITTRKMQENAIALIISFQMGDSYNSGSQLGAPVAKEPPLLTHRTWNFPCNLLDLGVLRRLPLIAEEAVKPPEPLCPKGIFMYGALYSHRKEV